jgi:hypothetical protein
MEESTREILECTGMAPARLRKMLYNSEEEALSELTK